MALLSLHDIHLSYGGHPLFDGLALNLEAGDRCCLLGRNGAGKSTLMKLAARAIEPDRGTVSWPKGLRAGFLGQDMPSAPGQSVGDFVTADARLPGTAAEDAAALRQRAVRIMDQLGLDATGGFDAQSGGTRRRALLARVLAAEPDLLLLDEPTNHLDLDSIQWLEEQLARWRGAVLFVTHDRSFARRVANRMAELDRGALYRFDTGFDAFMARREELLAAEASRRALFDKRLAEEEAWIRRGVKARRTRDEGRVKALMAMREEKRTRRDRLGSVAMRLTEARPSGDLVLETAGLGFAWPGAAVVDGLDLRVERGDRIGIIGPNGAGKTTLVRLLLGELPPQRGTVRHGTRLEVVYFDQLRASLDPDKSVAENLAGKDDSVVVGGVQRHVLAYLGDFLFSPDRARNPVSILSGGEKNRLLLAKLFLRPSNLLVLDEPTNDLDSDTLDLLEDLLAEYQGTLLVVSHDRDFLDNAVTSLLVMGDGKVEEFVGGWSDYTARKAALAAAAAGTVKAAATPGTDAPEGNARSTKRAPRLGFKETKELEELPARIGRLEEEQAGLHRELEDPALYRAADGPARVQVMQSRLTALEAELEAAYARWEELEGIKAAGS